MSKENLIRWGGPAAVAGGLAYLAVALLTVAIYVYEVLRGPVFEAHAFIHAFDTPMFGLLAIGLTGLYLHQRDRFGKAGKAGFVLAFAGFGLGFLASLAVIVVGLTMGDEATLGVLDMLAHPLPQLFYTIGSLLFGIATYRAGMLPRVAAVMVAVAPVLLLAMMMSGLVGPDQAVHVATGESEVLLLAFVSGPAFRRSGPSCGLLGHHDLPFWGRVASSLISRLPRRF